MKYRSQKRLTGVAAGFIIIYYLVALAVTAFIAGGIIYAIGHYLFKWW